MKLNPTVSTLIYACETTKTIRTKQHETKERSNKTNRNECFIFDPEGE